MGKAIFVAGTDTDIGKTIISSKLLEQMVLQNKDIAYYKPVQSGGSDDTDYIGEFGVKVYNSYTFNAPFSPHYAAELEHVTIDKEKLILDYKSVVESHDYTVVEGAGGIIVPLIRAEYYLYDLIADLKIPVLLVTELKVGSINHTALAYEFLKSKGIEVRAIFANRYQHRDYEIDNKKVIENYTGIEVITELGGEALERLFK